MAFNFQIKAGNRTIGTDQPVFVVAEIGINHNGDMDLARRTIKAAAESGADAVKFQNYSTEDFLQDESLTYTYINDGKEIKESQWSMFKRCELAESQLYELKKYTDEVGILFFSTPTSEAGIRILQKIGVPLIKNGSDFLTNLELIKTMADTGIPIILSTGMATLEEISDAVECFETAGGNNLILLHCTSSYPTPDKHINLRKIQTLSEKFKCPVGFSDHSDGVIAAISSVVLGACFIEKHFTLDKNLPGPDHAFSSDPEELSSLVKAIRNVEVMLGTSVIGPAESEKESRLHYRLSCVAASDIPAGTKLAQKHIKFGRPGTGIPPKEKSSLINRVVKTDLIKGQLFTMDQLL